MRAEIKWVEPNDYPGWDAFAEAERSDPWDDFGWFSLGIGPDDEQGADVFQILVATPAAVTRAQGDGSRFKGMIVDVFQPDAIAAALRRHVSDVSGKDWSEIVSKLRHSMRWEYEGM